MNENKILIIDIETTGFQPKGLIVEIGIVELCLNTGNSEIIFDSLCREDGLNAKHREYLTYKEKGKEPPKSALGWIFGNSSLTPDKLRNAPNLKDIKKEIQAIINKYPLGITAFNRMFDIKYLKSRGFDFPKLQPCPMLALAPIMKLPYPNGKGSGKWPTVEEAWRFLFPGVEYNELHRGADDALHESKILYESVNRGYIKLS